MTSLHYPACHTRSIDGRTFRTHKKETNKKTRFMSTGIPVRSLPDELVQELLNFKYVGSEAQLYDFLESYSS